MKINIRAVGYQVWAESVFHCLEKNQKCIMLITTQLMNKLGN